jgi:hypothetical protein
VTGRSISSTFEVKRIAKGVTMRDSKAIRPLITLGLAVFLTATQSGCIGFASTLMYWIKGNKVDARCTALEGKRVAVVCVTGSGVSGSTNEGEVLARAVAMILEKNVKKVDIVRPEEVADWRDQNNWDEVDYKSIGRGVKADMVVAIDMASFGIHDNPTLLRGRASIKTTVYDIADKGKIVFRDGPKEFAFPENGAQHVVENETNFKRIYLTMLAQDIAKNFYAYDKLDDVARDAMLIN